MEILYLIWKFIVIGCLSFGGGLVVLPFVQDIAVETGWITGSQIIEMIAIAEITPGPLAVNIATYVGYIAKGLSGGIITTFALILPQMLIAFFVYKIFNKFKNNNNMEIILRGIRPVALALTAVATIEIIKKAFLITDSFENVGGILNVVNIKALVLGVVIIFMMRKIKWHPIVYFLICGVIGILFNLT